MAHTASYSSAAPHAGSAALDVGRTMRQADGRGVSSEEVQAWKRSTEYKGWSTSDAAVKWFWQLLESWNPTRRAHVLQLATGTAAAPPGGFESLMGHAITQSDAPCRFTVCKLQPRQAKAKGKTQSPIPKGFLPLNRLYLPEARSKQELARGLEEAVQKMLAAPVAPAVRSGPRGEHKLMQGLKGKEKAATGGGIFTILEEELTD